MCMYITNLKDIGVLSIGIVHFSLSIHDRVSNLLGTFRARNSSHVAGSNRTSFLHAGK